MEGELVGGCDIMIEMFQAGELQTLIKKLPPSTNRMTPPPNKAASASCKKGSQWLPFYFITLFHYRHQAMRSMRAM